MRFYEVYGIAGNRSDQCSYLWDRAVSGLGIVGTYEIDVIALDRGDLRPLCGADRIEELGDLGGWKMRISSVEW